MGSQKVINFNAGPAKLPEEVLLEVQRDLIHFADSQVSVLEMSHRSSEFEGILRKAQESLRSLLNIPDNYKILFMAGGATAQFAAVPLNLMGKTGSADYVVTGTWSAKAAKEAAKYGKVNLVLPKVSKYTEIPDQSSWKTSHDACYLYYCCNETVDGVEFPNVPEIPNIPLVCDMSSNFLTRSFDITKFGVVFAGAQKNVGPAGVTIVIIRQDLIGTPASCCPAIMSYKIMDADNSLHNTPPTFSIYVTGLVFEWIKQQTGLEGMEERSRNKSKRIYSVIEQSNGFYVCPVQQNSRSRVNIPFRLREEKLEKLFLTQAENLNMLGLQGHRSVGGVRASLYNAISVEESERLATFMEKFLSDNSL